MDGSRATGFPVRVLLADDHTVFRQGLAGISASYGGVEVVAEVPNDGEHESAHPRLPDALTTPGAAESGNETPASPRDG